MASLSPYAITLGSTDYPVKYAGLLSYVEPYLTNLESFTFSAGNVSLAGNFTLGAASDLTLNKGTANGVLYLNGSKVATSGSALTFDGTNAATTGTSSATKFIPTGGTATGNGMYLSAANTLGWSTNGTKQLELDSSGNLGLGVTPSAWLTYTALQIKNSALSAIDNNQIVLSQNGLYTTGSAWKYINTNYATLYQQTSGQHLWFTAPSGTAGNTISFTQAMTLDASGNLVVGTTATAQGRVHAHATANAQFVATDATIGSTYGGVFRGYGVGGVGGYAEIGSLDNGVFTKGIQVQQQATAIAFFTGVNTAGNTERARITSGGDLLVGTTSSTTNTIAANKAGDQALYVRNTNNSTPFGLWVNYQNAAPNGTGNDFVQCQDNVAIRAAIRSNGGLANYSANDVNLSDRREKTNFAPAKSYLDTICAIPVQTFEYIDQSPDDPGLTLGVVAQDVQAVAPELVMESNWGTEDNPKIRLSIYQTDLQYALMKCIQELKAQNDELRARVAALEGV